MCLLQRTLLPHQEQLVQREHRRESVRHRKQERELQIKAGLRPGPRSTTPVAAAANSSDAIPAAPTVDLEAEEDEAIVSRGLVITYCALDYPRLLDSVRWRLETMKKNLQVCVLFLSAALYFVCAILCSCAESLT